jgi:integrase/recombinase XerD
MVMVSGVRFTGPLSLYAEGFAGELSRLGYTRRSGEKPLLLMAQLSRWLAEQQLDTPLRPQIIYDFVASRGPTRASGGPGYSVSRMSGPVALLVGHLQAVGVVGGCVAAEHAPVEALLASFSDYLTNEHGLAVLTVQRDVGAVRAFVTARMVDGSADLAGLTAADVSTFMLEVARDRPAATVRRTATALRSLLRYLHTTGMLSVSLVGAVPSAACWQQTSVPRGIEPDEVTRLLASCDRRTRAGRRDFAILLLLIRLGLRAGEAARLSLDDIDWRAGEIVVAGKGSRRDRLPLPDDVGRAVVGYLQQGRPSTAQGREVFVRLRAPHRRLTGSAVSHVVIAASQRAGLRQISAHRLRHTAASQLLAAGAPLTEIGQLLRHQKAATTAIYAKVDREALRRLARRWPGGAA